MSKTRLVKFLIVRSPR